MGLNILKNAGRPNVSAHFHLVAVANHVFPRSGANPIPPKKSRLLKEVLR